MESSSVVKFIEGDKGQKLITEIAMNFAIPFVVQLGFGADVGVAAKRAAIAGTSLSVVSGSIFLVSDSITNADTAQAITFGAPFLGAALYAGAQEFGGFNSQGMAKDFTFAAVSGLAATTFARMSWQAFKSLRLKVKLAEMASD